MTSLSLHPTEYSQYSRQIKQALTRRDEAVAFIDGDRSLTFAQARARVSQFVQVFQEQEVGDAVGALSKNSPEIYLADLATMLYGSRFTGLHPLGAADAHAKVCDDAGISTLIVETEFAELAREVASLSSTVKKVFVLGPTGYGADLISLADAKTPVELEVGPARGSDIARVMYTGGTTGDSKGCALTHNNVATLVMNAPAAWQLPTEPVFLASAPITHATFLFLLSTLAAGGTIVMQRGFHVDEWVDAIEKNRVNCAFIVPTIIYLLLEQDLSKRDLSSIETIAYGGSTVAAGKLLQAAERLGNVFVQVYGQTECLAQGLSLLKEEHDFAAHPELAQSAGRPVPGAEVTIRDDDGYEVPDGTAGEICIRAGTVMREYWGRPDASAETLANGWLHTGDIGIRNEQGYYFVVDRKKDMIISGGFNVFPSEVETVLNSHEAVANAAVVGVPSEKWVEEVKGVVVLKAGHSVTDKELIALVKAKKGSLYAPKSIDFVAELPQTAVGKVDKKMIRAEYWKNEQRQV